VVLLLFHRSADREPGPLVKHRRCRCRLVGCGALACPAQMKQHPSRTSGLVKNSTRLLVGRKPMPPCARHMHITHILSTSRYSLWVTQLRALENPQGTIRVRRDAEDRYISPLRLVKHTQAEHCPTTWMNAFIPLPPGISFWRSRSQHRLTKHSLCNGARLRSCRIPPILRQHSPCLLAAPGWKQTCSLQIRDKREYPKSAPFPVRCKIILLPSVLDDEDLEAT
ncbi:conserved hypothetical protein, partial [Coccidioides posadasii str. Silveira]